VYTGK